jgi:hypothetical protein
MIKLWKEFIDDLPVDVQLLHKDEFEKEFDIKNMQFPAGFFRTDNSVELMISAEEINNCKTLPDLIELVENKLRKI